MVFKQFPVLILYLLICFHDLQRYVNCNAMNAFQPFTHRFGLTDTKTKTMRLIRPLIFFAMVVTVSCTSSDAPEPDNTPDLRALSVQEKTVSSTNAEFSVALFSKVAK